MGCPKKGSPIIASDQLVGINFILIHQNFDEVDQCQDAANAAAQAQDNFENALFGLAHHKVMDAQTAQKEADNSNSCFVLTCQVAALLQCNAAVQAYICALCNSSAAVAAVAAACTNLYAAVQADSLVVIHFFAAICTIHKIIPFLFLDCFYINIALFSCQYKYIIL